MIKITLAYPTESIEVLHDLIEVAAFDNESGSAKWGRFDKTFYLVLSPVCEERLVRTYQMLKENHFEATNEEGRELFGVTLKHLIIDIEYMKKEE